MMHVQQDMIKIFDTLDLTQRQIPVVSLCGGEGGATVWVVANCHGDEVTGIEVIHQVIDQLKANGLLRGTLHTIPVLNPIANEVMQRNVPLDDQNMNRVFPGLEDGNFTERMASKIYKRIMHSSPDLVIDLHTMHTRRTIPFVILDRCLDGCHRDMVERMRNLAHAFGITVVYDFAAPLYRQLKLSGSLSGALVNRAGMIAYTVELGPNREIDSDFVQAGVYGILNVLKSMRMIDTVPVDAQETKKLPTSEWLRRDPGIRVNNAGILRFLVEPGDPVSQGQPVAEVKNIVGDVIETVLAPDDGFALHLSGRGTVLPGMEIIGLAVPDG